MANIRQWLEKVEQHLGEQIETIVIGKHDLDEFSYDPPVDRRPEHARDKMLDRTTGLAILDAEFNNGYGGASCFPMYAWSANHFFTISEYDGATGLNTWPRHPIDCQPRFD